MKQLTRYGLMLVALFIVAGVFYSQAQKDQQVVDSPQDVTTTTTSTTSQEPEEISQEDEIELDDQASEETEETQKESSETENESSIDLAKFEFIDGKEEVIDITDNIGRPMVVNMWATWCPPCREEMPAFQKAWEDHKEDVDFFMVNALHSKPGENKEAVDRFVEKHKLSLPIYYDLDLATMIEVQATFLPTTLFINKEGEIVHHQIGMISPEDLEKHIESIL
ncbi:TlpA family protein disulfide reductase [Facklamia languida]